MKYDGSKGLLGLSTMYKIGSKADLRPKNADFKIENTVENINDSKPNLVFNKSESVLDDEGRTKYLTIWNIFKAISGLF